MQPTHFKDLFNKLPIFHYYSPVSQNIEGLKWFHGPERIDEEKVSRWRKEGYAILQTTQCEQNSFDSLSLREFIQSALRFFPLVEGEVFISKSYDFEAQAKWLKCEILISYADKFQYS